MSLLWPMQAGEMIFLQTFGWTLVFLAIFIAFLHLAIKLDLSEESDFAILATWLIAALILLKTWIFPLLIVVTIIVAIEACEPLHRIVERVWRWAVFDSKD